MNQEEIDSLEGRTQALSMVLTSLIAAIPRETASATLLQLQAGFDVEREQDALDPVMSEIAIRSRDGVLQAYLGLLDVRSRP